MAAKVGQMTKDELREMIDELIDAKLAELLDDPDKASAIKRSFHDRLVRQKGAVARGERGETLDGVVERLGLR